MKKLLLLFFVIIIVFGVIYIRYINELNNAKVDSNCFRLYSYPQKISNIQKLKIGQGQSVYVSPIVKVSIGDLVCFKDVMVSKLVNKYPYHNYKYPEVTIYQGSYILEMVTEYRQYRIDTIRHNIKEPYSNLILGISMGFDGHYPDFYEEMMGSSGLMHLFVASGSNILICLSVVDIGFRLLDGKYRILISILIISIYILLVGPEIPILRAYLSYIFTAYSRITGSYYSGVGNTTIIMAVFLLFSPNLVFNISFQLSFIATYCVLFSNNIIDFLGIQSEFFTQVMFNLLVFIFMSPILIFYFGQINLLTPFFNLMVNWIMTFCFILGLIIYFIYFDLLKIILIGVYYSINAVIQLNGYDQIAGLRFTTNINPISVFVLYFILIVVILVLSYFRSFFLGKVDES